MKHAIALALAISLAGCAYQPPRPAVFPLTQEFDATQAKRQILDGSNAIKGNAFMRQRGGGVVTCAGATVSLVPATAYAKERIDRIYGGKASARPIDAVFEPDPAEYKKLIRTTRCDAQGNFQFDRVADGEFFLTTAVIWNVSSQLQGGTVVQMITLANGQTLNTVLTD